MHIMSAVWERHLQKMNSVEQDKQNLSSSDFGLSNKVRWDHVFSGLLHR